MFFLGIESFITLFYKKILARFDTIGNTLLCFYPKMKPIKSPEAEGQTRML